MQKTDNWSAEWKSSTDPSKQRKYRENAPLHVKDKLLSGNLDPELREELGTRSIPIRTGDRVKVMRGDFSGEQGIVNDIDREEERLFANGIEIERQDGTGKEAPLRPSNVQVIALNIDDERRLEKYQVEDIESIGVSEEEMEEALEEDEENEMMQRMQEGEAPEEELEELEEVEEDEQETEEVEDEEEAEAEDETDETGEAEDSEEETAEEADYDEIVSGTISDAKGQLNELDNVNWEEVLEAEKDNKNRTTFTDWIEKRQEE